MQSAFESAGPRWARWDGSLRSNIHFRSFATKDASKREGTRIRWPPSWDSSPQPIVDSHAKRGVMERAKSAPPARCNRKVEEKDLEGRTQRPRWDTSLETSIRERVGKSQLKVTLPKYAEPFRPKSAPRPSRPNSEGPPSPVQSWDGTLAVNGRPEVAIGRSCRDGFPSSRSLQGHPALLETLRRSSQDEKRVSALTDRYGFKRPLSKRPISSKDSLRLRESFNQNEPLAFDYGTKRGANTKRNGSRADEGNGKVVSKSQQSIESAADAALAKALSLLKTAPPSSQILSGQPKKRIDLGAFETEAEEIRGGKSLSKSAQIAHSRPRMSLSRQNGPVENNRLQTKTAHQVKSNLRSAKNFGGLAKRIVAATGVGAADCFGLNRASEGLRVWKSAGAARSARALVELGRKESTGVFVKLVMTDRERAPGAVRFSHAAELTEALEEVGFGKIRFHGDENPTPTAPVFRTFKLGAQTVIGRHLSVTLYPRGGSSESHVDIAVQRIFVGRGDPSLLSESVLMMRQRPENRAHLPGSLRHVFVEVPPVKKTEKSNETEQRKRVITEESHETEQQKEHAISSEDSAQSGESLADVRASHFLAAGSFAGQNRRHIERLTSESPGPDRLGGWPSGHVRPSLEQGMPAYVPGEPGASSARAHQGAQEEKGVEERTLFSLKETVPAFETETGIEGSIEALNGCLGTDSIQAFEGSEANAKQNEESVTEQEQSSGRVSREALPGGD